MPRKHCLQLALALSVGCSQESVILLAFQATEELNTQAQLVDQVRRLELHVDGSDGPLAGLPSETAPAGDGVAVDRDGDGILEWVARPSVEDPEALPIVELFAGSNSNRDLEISAFGIGAGSLVANGKIERVRFEEGQTIEVEMPLDLLPLFRAPRVLAMDAEIACGQAAASATVTIEFSEPMNIDSVRGIFIEAPGIGPEPRTMLGVETTFKFILPVQNGTWQVTAYTSVLDESGTQLDQDLETPAPEDYFGTFEVNCP